MWGKGERKGVVKTVARMRLVVWLRPHLPALAVVLALMLIQSAAMLLQPWLGGVMTDRLMLNQHLGVLLWLLFGLICMQQGLSYVTALQLQKVSGRLQADAGAELYAHLQALPLEWHNARQRGDVLALLYVDIYRIGRYVTGTLLPLLPLLFTLVGALAMMLHLAPPIAVMVAVLMPLMFLALKWVGRKLRPLSHASAQAWAEQSSLAEQNLESLALIKAFGTEAVERANFRQRADTVYATDLRLEKLQGAINPVVYVIGAGAILLLLGLGGHLVIRSEMRMGELVSVFLYGMVLVGPVGSLASVYGSTMAAMGSLRRLSDALNAAPEVDAGTQTVVPVAGDIVYSQVDFTYPGREPLFSGLDLTIRAGETVALTGVNGAGKSTLVHLLLRLVEPQGGSVTIGGIDLREFRLQALRGQIGLVAQQVLLFNATVRDNIAYGRVDASQGAIARAAQAARAHDFIAQLPQGYDTVIGDQGVKLSGGQKQRIALARALLKDPPILILDEATAMFDPAGELEFIDECREVLANRTVILITHRPASLALADRVVRLEGGRLQDA
jgi:ABC-type multidrug transport system fused ATPase/permease subunit